MPAFNRNQRAARKLFNEVLIQRVSKPAASRMHQGDFGLNFPGFGKQVDRPCFFENCSFHFRWTSQSQAAVGQRSEAVVQILLECFLAPICERLFPTIRLLDRLPRLEYPLASTSLLD